MKFSIFLFISFIISTSLFAQSRTITGIVYVVDTVKQDALNWRPDTTTLYGAKICLLENLNVSQEGQICSNGTISDKNGKFEIVVEPKYNYMEVSDFGLISQTIKIPQTSDIIEPIILLSIKSFPKTTRDKNMPPGSAEDILIQKPAIYLYPTKETTISIKHDFKGQIETTYPDYNNGWNVVAQTNGTLLNLANKRSYEYLFWDGSYAFPDAHFEFKDGFVVQKQNLNGFLLEKLTLIGLNNKEINDFIVYWLPVLNKNESNFIHFRINDNIDNASVLHVSPEPDSWIRLFMEFKEVDKTFSISEQVLKSCSRKGFTLVEWGGGKIEKVIKVM